MRHSMNATKKVLLFMPQDKCEQTIGLLELAMPDEYISAKSAMFNTSGRLNNSFYK